MTHCIDNIGIFDSEKENFYYGRIEYSDGVITSVTPTGDYTGGDRIIPGLIDIHTHGRHGIDFDSATPEELELLKKDYAASGVTTPVPTLASAPFDKWLIQTERFSSVGFSAVHYEGRYLNPQFLGAQDPVNNTTLDVNELEKLFDAGKGMKKYVSAAYELDNGNEFLNYVIKNGGVAGFAHTGATYKQAIYGIENGVTLFTHLFNAMTKLHHREGGAPAACLLSDTYAELICDGFHISPEIVRLVYRTKGAERIILVTDSIEATGLPDGKYYSCGYQVTLKNNKATLDDGTLAGSTLNLFDAMMNFCKFCGISLEKAVNTATLNPARALGLENIGAIRKGFKADFFVLDEDNSIKSIVKNGEIQ